MIDLINQIFEIDQKSKKNGYAAIDRNLNRVMHHLVELGYEMENPHGKVYKITDTAVEANISEQVSDNPTITKVVKPIIYFTENGIKKLVQKGIVFVE